MLANYFSVYLIKTNQLNLARARQQIA